MARALILGCGCRGRMLGKRLRAQGWEVRGTSRYEDGLAEIEAVGIEPAFADPAQPATVLELIADVAVIYWLFGAAEGEPEELSAIHGRGLDRVLERLVETPVRGFVYEMGGTVDPILLARGREALEGLAERSEIPISFVFVDPSNYLVWLDTMAGAGLDRRE